MLLLLLLLFMCLQIEAILLKNYFIVSFFADKVMLHKVQLARGLDEGIVNGCSVFTYFII
jgi:hypothetical protein